PSTSTGSIARPRTSRSTSPRSRSPGLSRPRTTPADARASGAVRWRRPQGRRRPVMSIAPRTDWNFVPPPVPVRRFTVDEYHRMIDAGIFGEDERFELLEGWIVYKMTRKPPHDATIELVSEVLR